jgi:hypothetical protein
MLASICPGAETRARQCDPVRPVGCVDGAAWAKTGFGAEISPGSFVGATVRFANFLGLGGGAERRRGLVPCLATVRCLSSFLISSLMSDSSDKIRSSFSPFLSFFVISGVSVSLALKRGSTRQLTVARAWAVGPGRRGLLCAALSIRPLRVRPQRTLRCQAGPIAQ